MYTIIILDIRASGSNFSNTLNALEKRLEYSTYYAHDSYAYLLSCAENLSKTLERYKCLNCELNLGIGWGIMGVHGKREDLSLNGEFSGSAGKLRIALKITSPYLGTCFSNVNELLRAVLVDGINSRFLHKYEEHVLEKDRIKIWKDKGEIIFEAVGELKIDQDQLEQEFEEWKEKQREGMDCYNIPHPDERVSRIPSRFFALNLEFTEFQRASNYGCVLKDGYFYDPYTDSLTSIKSLE